MNKKLLIGLAALLGVGGIVTGAIVAANNKKPEATPTPAPTAIVATNTTAPTQAPTATSTPKPTNTSTPKPTATSTPKPTATSTPTPTPTTAVVVKDKDIVILYTNDVHTYIDSSKGKLSYDSAAQMKKDLIEAGNDVLLVDAGDHIQGTAFGGLDEGKGITELMAAAGYDLATLGNHEFDYGMARALEVMNGKIAYVSANFRGADGKTVLDAYKIFEVGGKKVAFIGITTPESITKSTPKYFMDENGNYIYSIDSGEDGKALYETVQKTIDAAKAAGADYVIALGHLGVDASSAPWRSTDVIANVTGLDAFIDGHSHTTMESKEVKDAAGNTVILTQTGEYFKAIGQMTISDGKITTKLVSEYASGDKAVSALVTELETSVNNQLSKVIGYANTGIYAYDPATGTRLIRKQESNLGDFCADAIYYLFDTTEGLDIDVAIMNGGGIRADLPAGEITYATCKKIHTFGNVMCLMEVTGQQIQDMLEWAYKNVGESENGAFLQVSGLTCTVDASIPANVVKDEKGLWKSSNNAEYRVKNIKIYDKTTGKYVALDLKKTYRIGGTNYTLRDLGDGYSMFAGATLVKDYVMMDYLALANYVESFPETETAKGTLPTITGYTKLNGEGRIKIVNGSTGSETGDSNMIVALFALVLMAGAATVITKRKQRA